MSKLGKNLKKFPNAMPILAMCAGNTRLDNLSERE